MTETTEINHEDVATAAIDATAETIIEAEAEVATTEVATPVEHDAAVEVIEATSDETAQSDEEVKSEAKEAIAA